MMGRVVSAISGAGVENVCVVSPDRIVLAEAGERGATPLLQESRGLNPALEEGRRWTMVRGGSSLLVLPADLPLIDAEDVSAVVEGAGGAPSMTISPDGAHSGTNALLLRPPDVLPFVFGPGSYEAHLRAARERPHLAFDLDTAEDLARLDEEIPRP
jgi:2-phospho-L-lactate/phosphoenolpyruvate guanylyltransferase